MSKRTFTKQEKLSILKEASEQGIVSLSKHRYYKKTGKKSGKSVSNFTLNIKGEQISNTDIVKKKLENRIHNMVILK